MANKRVVALPSEDVGAVVVDVGASETRAGFAGEDTPKALFPSFLGLVFGEFGDVAMTGAVAEEEQEKQEKQEKRLKSRRQVGAAALSYRRDDMELKSPFDADGVPSDMSVVQVNTKQDFFFFFFFCFFFFRFVSHFQLCFRLFVSSSCTLHLLLLSLSKALLNHAFEERLLCDVREHPVLLVEPSWNSNACREQLTELMFERFATPGLFVSKSAVLATFMNARASGVVLDSGHMWSSAVPVHEGYVLKKCIQRSPVAGARINHDLLSFLQRESGGAAVHPQYECARKLDPATGTVVVTLHNYPRTHPSYRQFAVDQVIRDLKENTCRVSETDYSDAEYEKVAPVPYELPDGRVVQMGGQRFKSAELLFKPDIYAPGAGGDARGMHELVYAAIQVGRVTKRKSYC